MSIFRLNFDKANHSFLHPILLLGETDLLGETENSAWDFKRGKEVGIKMPRFNAFSRNVKIINLRFFPYMVGYTS